MAHPLSITLFVLYSALGAYCLAQIVILLRQKHKPFSYKIVFNGLAITWMFLRALYWALSITDLDMSQTATYFLFWLPHTILYTTFATMALFLTKVIKRREWTPKIRNRFLIWYTVFGVLDVTGTIILSVVAGIGDDQFADEMDNIESCGNGVLFLGLAVVYMTLGHHLRRLQSWEYNRMFMFEPRTLSTVAWALAAVFLSRCIWNFVTFSGAVDIQVGNDDAKDVIVALVAYLIWELLPLVLLLSTIAAGPTGASSHAAGTGKEALLNFGVFGAIDAIEAEEAAGTGDGEEGDDGGDSAAMLKRHSLLQQGGAGGGGGLGGDGRGGMQLAAGGGGHSLLFGHLQAAGADDVDGDGDGDGYGHLHGQSAGGAAADGSTSVPIAGGGHTQGGLISHRYAPFHAHGTAGTGAGGHVGPASSLPAGSVGSTMMMHGSMGVGGGLGSPGGIGLGSASGPATGMGFPGGFVGMAGGGLASAGGGHVSSGRSVMGGGGDAYAVGSQGVGGNAISLPYAHFAAGGGGLGVAGGADTHSESSLFATRAGSSAAAASGSARLSGGVALAGLSGAGFLAAQHNAAKRSTYVPPAMGGAAASGSASVGGGAATPGGRLPVGGGPTTPMRSPPPTASAMASPAVTGRGGATGIAAGSPLLTSAGFAAGGGLLSGSVTGTSPSPSASLGLTSAPGLAALLYEQPGAGYDSAGDAAGAPAYGLYAGKGGGARR